MATPHFRSVKAPKGRGASSVAWLRAGVPIVLPLSFFGLLAGDVIERESFRFDTPILLWLHARQLPIFDAIMLGFSRIGGTLMLLLGALLSLVLWRLKRPGEAIFVIASLVGAAVLNLGAKTLFGRTRPDLWLSIAPEHDFGFPSGHAMLSTAFTGAFLVCVWRSDAPLRFKWSATTLGVIFVAMVGLSRLYLGVHYPSDVLAGWALSGAWVAALRLFLPTPHREQPLNVHDLAK